MKMTLERASDILKDTDSYDDREVTIALAVAARCVHEWLYVDRMFSTILEADSRSFENRETEDGLFFDGVARCRSMMREREEYIEVEDD